MPQQEAFHGMLIRGGAQQGGLLIEVIKIFCSSTERSIAEPVCDQIKIVWERKKLS